MGYQNTNINKVIEVSIIMKWITGIDPIAIQPCVTLSKYMEKGSISISSSFDITVLHICTFALIFGSEIYPKYGCECTANMQYCEAKLPADAYVTLLHVFANTDTRLYSNWINTCYPFHYIENIYDFIYTCILVPNILHTFD